MRPLSAALLLYTLILSVFAETQKFNFNIEKKDISPDGEEHPHSQYQATPLSDQLPRLSTIRVGNQRTNSRT
jgi:hypothetical protein